MKSCVLKIHRSALYTKIWHCIVHRFSGTYISEDLEALLACNNENWFKKGSQFLSKNVSPTGCKTIPHLKIINATKPTCYSKVIQRQIIWHLLKLSCNNLTKEATLQGSFNFSIANEMANKS